MPSILDEHQPFIGLDGKPLVNGRIFIGLQNQDPEANPQTIYSDRALTVSIDNPQTLDAYGRSTNKIHVAGEYSIRVDDSAGTQIYQELDAGGEGESSNIAFVPAGGGAVATTVSEKLKESVSAFDFMTAAEITDVETNLASVDVTTALQNAIDYGFENGYAVHMADGTYRTSKPLLVYGRSNANSPVAGTILKGTSRESTIIKKYGSDDTGTAFNYESNSVIIVVDEGAYAGGEASGNAKWVELQNLFLTGNSTDVAFGISLPNNSSDYKGINIRIEGMTDTGVYIDGNHWMSRWDKLYIAGGQYGFKYNSGIGTSTIWTHPYVIGTTVAAYDITGTYQTMISPAADGCTGIVYDLSSFKGTLISPGSESVDATTQVKIGQFADVSLVNPHFLMNVDDAAASQIEVFTGGKCQVYGGSINRSEIAETAAGNLYEVGASGSLSLYDVTAGLYSGANVINATALFSEQDDINRNGVNQRTGFAEIAANTTTTFTVTIGAAVSRGPVTIDFSALTTAASGSVMIKAIAAGYIFSTGADNLSELLHTSVNGTITSVSAITKTTNGFSFDIVNGHATAVGDLHWVATGIFNTITVVAS